ncbi:hypothetical protein [Streptomyces sp. NPDC058103]
MPDDVANRIDAALAAEALNATAPDGAVHVSRETELSVARKPDTASGPPDRPTGHPRAITGPGRRPARRRRGAVVLGAALGAAVVGVSVFMLQSVQPSQEKSDVTAADRGSSSAAKRAAAFSESALEGQVQTLLLNTKPSSPDDVGAEQQNPSIEAQSTPTPSATDAPRTPLRAPVVSVPACVEQGIGRETAALAMEEGTFEGSDAFLVVLPHSSDPTRVQAYVVDAACVRDEPASKGKLLLTHAYPRP